MQRGPLGKGVDCDKCIELAALHSMAVDYAKTGVPAVMRKELFTKLCPSYQIGTNKMKYESKTVIGRIHNLVSTLHEEISDIRFHFYSANRDKFSFDADLVVAGHETYLASAREDLLRYNERLFSLMRLYDIQDEMQVLSGHLPAYQRTSKGREESDRIIDQVRAIKSEFSKVFWEEFVPPAEGEAAAAERERVRRKASAWYCCTYEQIDRAKREQGPLLFFSFPWIVAETLCDIKIKARE